LQEEGFIRSAVPLPVRSCGPFLRAPKRSQPTGRSGAAVLSGGRVKWHGAGLVESTSMNVPEPSAEFRVPHGLPVGVQLELDKCPHCRTTRPTMTRLAESRSADYRQQHLFIWVSYACSVCGKGVLAGARLDPNSGRHVEHAGMFPAPRTVSDDIPDRARTYLDQALRSLSAPDGAVMLAASSVDAAQGEGPD
jgi:hypothetical protein